MQAFPYASSELHMENTTNNNHVLQIIQQNTCNGITIPGLYFLATKVKGHYFDMVDKLQKWVCRAVSRSLAACLETLAYHRHLACQSFFIGIILGDVHHKWLI